MNRLLIGFSSPIAYTYSHPINDKYPAPILESPIAYCLLYDELWFLHPMLCPPELAKLPFVKFVIQEYDIQLPFDRIPEEEASRIIGFDFKVWQRCIDSISGNHREFRCDNHSRPIEIGGIDILPTPGDGGNMFVDRYIASEFGFKLAENSPNSFASNDFEETLLHSQVTHNLTGPRFSLPQGVRGYWHDVLLELRNEPSLISFRQKIESLQLEDLEATISEAESLDAAYKDALRDSLDEHLSLDYVTLASQFVTSSIPVAGQILDAAELLATITEKRRQISENGWMRFLSQIERSAPLS